MISQAIEAWLKIIVLKGCISTELFWQAFLCSFFRFHLEIRVKQPHPKDCQGDSESDENREADRCSERDQFGIKTAQYIKYNVYRD